MLALIEAVMDDKAVIVFGSAPAIFKLVRTQIVDGNEVVTGETPWQIYDMFLVHGFLIAWTSSQSEMSLLYILHASSKAVCHLRHLACVELCLQ